MSWLGLRYKGTEPLYSREWNLVIDGLDILYQYTSAKLDKEALLHLDSDIIPDQDNIRNLGSETKSWKEVQAHYGYFKDNVYVQGKVVIKDGDPIKISEFISEAKTDIEKFYSLHKGIKEDTGKIDIPLSDVRSKIEQLYSIVSDISSKIARQLLQFDDGTIVQDTRFSKKVDEGKAFSASHRFENVASDEVVETFFENPSTSNKKANIITVEIVVQGTSFIDIYRDNVKVASGTRIPVMNLDLGSPNTSEVIVEYGGTYTPGTLAHQTVAPGGSKIRAIGSASEVGERVKIPPGYNILVRVINKAETPIAISTRFLWWEELAS